LWIDEPVGLGKDTQVFVRADEPPEGALALKLWCLTH